MTRSAQHGGQRPGRRRAQPLSSGPLTETGLVDWGQRIGRQIAAPVVLALRGELGAGKSVLARAIARGAGVTTPMPSPTFNLLFRYRAGRPLDVAHLDLFRLEDPEEVLELGWQDLGHEAEIVVIEWPERAEPLLPEPRWDIYLDMEGPAHRRVRAVPRGEPPALPPPPDTAR